MKRSARGTPEYRAYARLHAKLRRERGVARDLLCSECEGQASEWAQIHDTDGTDLNKHYKPMCKKCHHAYDYENWNQGIKERDTSNNSIALTNANRARWRDPKWRAKMSKAVAESNRRRAARND